MKQRIVFMGTPEFAVESLHQLLDAGIEVAAVVTVPDKKAGRGQHISESAVKKFATSKGLTVLQPEDLKSADFVETLKKFSADLFVVVAFRKLPHVVFSMPERGTINLHGSLLPDYRGAAPINWAVINGETKTGATTFFIEEVIDAGKIIDKVEIEIGPDENAGSVHDRLMVAGAKLLVTTVKSIFDGTATAQAQAPSATLKSAPKIFRDDCRIDWTKSCHEIHNLIRGLSPYPAAWTVLKSDEAERSLKIYSSSFTEDKTDHSGQINLECSKLKMGCSDGWIIPSEIQLEGKRRMSADEFLLGFDVNQKKLV